ncbi:hypothetical protein D0812_02355 [Vibrio owensii]|uniref:Uncharacterized protein n=1 Tax=Vibrio owensii TaxID=696485 RepID=A0AAP9K931_9VIBR|nr:hypothetical protein D0812_02355 [Vibrio owensii]QGH46016.1 hypothetical protein APZ19_02320 [Vibrio owensii]
MHSSEIIESVKHFFQLIFLEAFHLFDSAEALWRLPCRWMRIIGRRFSLARLKMHFF